MTKLVLVLLLQNPEVLVERWWSEDIEVREGASQELILLGASSVPALRGALDSGDAEVRTRAADALVKIGAPSVPVLSAARHAPTRTGRLAQDALFLLARDLEPTTLSQFPELLVLRDNLRFLPQVDFDVLMTVIDESACVEPDFGVVVEGLSPDECVQPEESEEEEVPTDPE